MKLVETFLARYQQCYAEATFLEGTETVASLSVNELRLRGDQWKQAADELKLILTTR
jgi:hypothetical protein